MGPISKQASRPCACAQRLAAPSALDRSPTQPSIAAARTTSEAAIRRVMESMGRASMERYGYAPRVALPEFFGPGFRDGQESSATYGTDSSDSVLSSSLTPPPGNGGQQYQNAVLSAMPYHAGALPHLHAQFAANHAVTYPGLHPPDDRIVRCPPNLLSISCALLRRFPVSAALDALENVHTGLSN